jgi:hypothetical protein
MSSVLIAQLANIFGAASNPWVYGKLIFAGSVFGYLGSLPSFWMAGKSYIKHIQQQTEKNEKAIEAIV